MTTPTMTCPDLGTLRAYLDHEASDHDALTTHVRSCLTCTREIRSLRADQFAAVSALDLLDETAARRQAPLRQAQGGGPAAGAGVKRRVAPWVAVAAVALSASLVVGTPTGRAMASDALRVFQSTSVQPIDVTVGDAASAGSILAQFASNDDQVMLQVKDLYPHGVGSLAEAAAAVPFQITVPTADELPDGLAQAPDSVLVTEGREITLNLDEAQTARYLTDNDSTLKIPAGFGDTSLTIATPDAVALQWYAKDGRNLVIGNSAPLGAATEGPLSLDQVIDFLLKVPGVPTDVVEQLRGTDLTSGVLPIPVPTDLFEAQATTIDQHDAVQVAQPGLGSGVVWQQDDQIVGVAGAYDLDTVRGLAQRLAEDLAS